MRSTRTQKAEALVRLKRAGVTFTKGVFMFGGQRISTNTAFRKYENGPHKYIHNPYKDCTECEETDCNERLRESIKLRYDDIISTNKAYLDENSKAKLINMRDNVKGAIATQTYLDEVNATFLDVQLQWEKDVKFNQTSEKMYHYFLNHVDPIKESSRALNNCYKKEEDSVSATFRNSGCANTANQIRWCNEKSRIIGLSKAKCNQELTKWRMSNCGRRDFGIPPPPKQFTRPLKRRNTRPLKDSNVVDYDRFSVLA